VNLIGLTNSFDGSEDQKIKKEIQPIFKYSGKERKIIIGIKI